MRNYKNITKKLYLHRFKVLKKNIFYPFYYKHVNSKKKSLRKKIFDLNDITKIVWKINYMIKKYIKF